MSFENLGLIQPLLSAVAEHGYTEPTPIQQATIETVLKGHDLMASAQTGTGKTAAFTLPLLQQLSSKDRTGKAPRALVVVPTRELAAQVLASIQTYGKHLELRALTVYGGVKIGPQIKALRQGIDIVVATPGRLLDLHQQNAIDLRHIEMLILDEADRMLDMGFIPDIRRIQSLMPAKKQSLMFSATFSREIRALAQTMLVNPVQIDVAPPNATADNVDQRVIPVEKGQKTALLVQQFGENAWNQTLIFTRTKHKANQLARDLSKAGISAEAIHGNKSQGHRTRVLAGFKQGKVAVLVATDIASRGLDISGLPLVINYEMPSVPEDYVHRIGRTGRAGKDGFALSLVCSGEVKQLRDIERLLNRPIERDAVEGFDDNIGAPGIPREHGQSGTARRGGNNNRRSGGGNGGNSNGGNSNGGNSRRSSRGRSSSSNNGNGRSQGNRSRHAA